MASKLFDKKHEAAFRAVPETTQSITKERLQEMLPAKTSIAVTDEILRLINNMEEDTGLPQELLEEDLMTHIHMLNGMRGAGIKELVNAIKFCNLKRNYDNKDAWAIVFPDKYAALVAANKQVDNHVSMYNGSKLVTTIDKEMLVPVHLTYAPYFHAAVKKQFEIMNGKAKDGQGKEIPVSAMVQHLAAKELATLTKQPEESKLSISINPSDAAVSAQSEMNSILKDIVASQRKQLLDGGDIIDVQVLGLNFAEVGRENE